MILGAVPAEGWFPMGRLSKDPVDFRGRVTTRHPVIKRRAMSVVVVLGLLAISACSNSKPTAPPAATSSSTSVETSGSPVGVTAVIGGHAIVGSCSGSSVAGSPTVVLVSGMGNPGSQLSSIKTELEGEVRVCSYDRPGLGRSEPTSRKMTLSSVVEDLAAFLEKGKIKPPNVLVGHSFGASVVIRYAQLYPDNVAGFVSMNPVPPYTSYLARASEVETPAELQTNEIDYYRGQNEESIDLRDTDLTLGPIEDGMPYVVMEAEDCPGDFCDRIRPVLAAATKELAGLGSGGRFIAVSGAGHDIFLTNLDDIAAEVRKLLR